MRLTYFVPTTLPNVKSHSIQILNTCRALAEAGADVEILVRRLTRPAEATLAAYGLPPHARLSIRTLPAAPRRAHRWSGRTFGFFISAYALARAIPPRRGCFYFRGGTKALATASRLLPLARRLGARAVYEAHTLHHIDAAERAGSGSAPPPADAGLLDLEASVYSQLDGVVTISHGLERLLKQTFALKCPTLVAPSGMTPSQTPPPALEARDLDLCYLGSLYPFNGLDVLIEAMTRLPGRRLAIIGDGDGPERGALMALAARLGVADRIDFQGRLPHPEALGRLRRARVVVAPLRRGVLDRVERYCSPAKLVEYLASGAVIVASRLPSIEELIEDGQNGLLVEPNSPAALAEGISRALEGGASGEGLARRAVQDARAYTYPERARRILAFLEGLFER